MTYDDITPPKTIDEAVLNIIKSLIMHIDMGIDEEFDYINWADGPKKKFDSAKKKLITTLEGWTKQEKVELGGFTSVVENTPTESSPFEFQTGEIKENIMTLEDYICVTLE